MNFYHHSAITGMMNMAGSFENRIRILLEIVEGVREIIEEKFAIIRSYFCYRLGGWWLDDRGFSKAWRNFKEPAMLI